MSALVQMVSRGKIPRGPGPRGIYIRNYRAPVRFWIARSNRLLRNDLWPYPLQHSRNWVGPKRYTGIKTLQKFVSFRLKK